MNAITFLEIEDWENEFIHSIYPDRTVFFTKQKAHEELTEDIYASEIISPFIYSQLRKEVLEKFPKLRLIATRSTGYDHIDIDYCRTRGIKVTHVPSYGAHTVAEHTFALLLAISRKIIPTIERSRHGNFRLEGLTGFDLFGKTIGIIGEGEIGKKVIDIALSFGMNVLVYTRHSGINRKNVTYVDLNTVFSSSDILSLHVPFTKETHHLINRESIKNIKKGAILLNTSRGQLVETQAILEGLKTGTFIAAGLDVLEEEGMLKEERELLTEDFLAKGEIAVQLMNHVLLTRDEVLFTAHNGFNSTQALEEILNVTVQNIQSFLSGTILNEVT